MCLELNKRNTKFLFVIMQQQDKFLYYRQINSSVFCLSSKDGEMIELPLVSIHHRGQETMISYNLLLSDADPACTLLLSDSLENCPHSPLSPVVSQVHVQFRDAPNTR